MIEKILKEIENLECVFINNSENDVNINNIKKMNEKIKSIFKGIQINPKDKWIKK